MELPDENDQVAITKFAMSFNAYEVYGSFEKASEVAKSSRRSSLEELRAELFMAVRGSNHRRDDAFMNMYKELKPYLEKYAGDKT